MPVHPRDRKENNHEEMDVDYPEQEASSSDEEDSVSSTASEDGDSSGNVNITDRQSTRKKPSLLLCVEE